MNKEIIAAEVRLEKAALQVVADWKKLIKAGAFDADDMSVFEDELIDAVAAFRKAIRKK